MKTTILGVVLVAVIAVPALGQRTLVVDLNGGGDFTEIQPAIDAAEDGDTVLVKPGEYTITESINFNPLHDPEDPASPPVKDIKLRSERGPEQTMIRPAAGVDLSYPDGVVLFSSGETNASVLEGFTLTGSSGCAVFCVSSSPALTRCTIRGNAHGGISCENSSLILTNCTISENGGSGVDCFTASPRLAGCTIAGNAGDGLHLAASSPILANCTIAGNAGLGVSPCVGYGESTPTLTSCIVWDNTDVGLSQCDDKAVVTYSCVEGDQPWPGEGNINADPVFCGWTTGEALVRNQVEFVAALRSFRVSLSKDSPCVGSGEGGANMGADTGMCDAAGEAERVIRLARGRYEVGVLNLTHRVSLEGAGAEETIIEGTILGLRTGAVLSGITVTGTKEGRGGIQVAQGAAPMILSCTISGNSGSGVSCSDGANPTLRDCLIRGNQAYDGGGVSCREASVTLDHCTIVSNQVTNGRAGVSLYGSSAIISNSILWDNVGDSLSADENSTTEVRHSCIEAETRPPGEGNTNDPPLFCGWDSEELAVSDQAAFERAVGSSGYSLSLSPASPCLGTAEGGGNMGAETGQCDRPAVPGRRILLAAGRYTMPPGENLAHRVSLEGEGADRTVIDGTLRGPRTGASITRLTVSGDGIGILVTGEETPVISNCTLARNSNGISCQEGSSPTVRDCVIIESRHAGVYCDDRCTATFLRCTITRNSGGGVACFGSTSASFTDCRITGNRGDLPARNPWSPIYGGGVTCWSGAQPRFVNCEITGNLAAFGGGIYCWHGSSPTFINCTISGNSADSGGGLFCVDRPPSPTPMRSSPIMVNCIVWGNSGGSIFLQPCRSPPRCVEPSPRVTYSCTESEEIWNGEGNINESPLFVRSGVFDFERFETIEIAGNEVQLPDFVVDPGDYHLQAGSPCMDSGIPDGVPTTDFEGKERPCGHGVDMGAYETGDCPEPPPFKRGDANADGSRNVTDVVFVLDRLFGGGPEMPCAKSADTNDSGRIDIADPVYLLNALFAGGASIPAPFPDCGLDLTPDELSCLAFEGCE